MSPPDDVGQEELETFRAYCTPPKDAAARNWKALSKALADAPVELAPRRAARATTAWVAGAVLAAAVALMWLRLSIMSTTSEEASDPGSAMRTAEDDATGGNAIERDTETQSARRRAGPPTEPQRVQPEPQPVDPPAVEAPTTPEPPAIRKKPRPAPIEPNPSPVDRLREEARLIASARAALQKHDHAGALKLLREHEQQFPSGAMVTDRNAWMAVALCRSGKREEGARRGRQFLAKRPSSTHAEEIRQACEIE